MGDRRGIAWWGWRASALATVVSVAGASLLAGPASAARRAVRAPALTAPANEASLQALPAFTWRSVRGAASYDFEFSADRGFSSAVNGFGVNAFGSATGATRVTSTAISNTKAIPDGTYYWRVRAVSAADHPGPWSAVRVLGKHWSAMPLLQSPLGSTVQWPSQPLVFRWSPVPYAAAYDVYIATDPALSHLVLGSVSQPVQVQGTQFAFPSVLAPATYYWAVQPVDAEGYRGIRSSVGTFTWAWPSTTTVNETDVSPDATVNEPSFSWNAIPGASSYEIEINRTDAFSAGSDVIDQTKLPGTSYTPLNLLPNETTLYWRVRAQDANGDDGAWNAGQPFTETFDTSTPSVQNLKVTDPSGNNTDPIVSWDPVPGASSYFVVVAVWDGSACEFDNDETVKSMSTPSTYWTPIGDIDGPGEAKNTSLLHEYGWPAVGGGIVLNHRAPPGTTGQYCVSVAPQRDSIPLGGGQMVRAAPTLLGGGTAPSFTYTTPLPQAGTLAPAPASAYLQPAAAGAVPNETATPLFQWNAMPGAAAYYVVISRDVNFTNIVYVGYTQTTAYIPPISLQDENVAYNWEVIPQSAAGVVPVGTNGPANVDNPQAFDKSSNPPMPVAPLNGATAQTQPTFSWTSAAGARDYTLQIAQDPSFVNPIAQVTTPSTSFTSTTLTLPADQTLYWRVRANDWQGTGLNWSWPTCQSSTFTHHLPAPAPAATNPVGGSTIPLLSWSPVSGATSYNMFVTQANGTTKSFSFAAPEMTPTMFYGTGIWHWTTQAVFPGGATSSYFAPSQGYVRTIPALTGIRARRTGSQVIISWAPDPIAKQYSVQISTTDGFSSSIAGATTDDNVWVPQLQPTTAGKRLYWRVAAVDSGGNIGAYVQGQFRASRRHRAEHRHSKHRRSKHGRSKHRHPTNRHRRG